MPNPPCQLSLWRKPEYQEKTHNFRQSVDFYSFHMKTGFESHWENLIEVWTCDLRGSYVAIGGVWHPPPPNNSNIGQSWSKYLPKVGQNGTDICLKLKKKLVKVWDKIWSKLSKFKKWFAILTILKLLLRLRWKNWKFCSSWSKRLVRKIFFDYSYVSPENFFDLTSPRRQHFQEIFLRLGQNPRKGWSKHDDTPPPPNVDGFATSLLRGERQVRSPLRHRKSQIGKLSPQAYVPYNYSLAPEPCYFQQGVYNSFCDK